jgi:hypothetical protein
MRASKKTIDMKGEAMTTIDQISHFIHNNVIGKTLKTEDTVYQLEEGKLEGVYTDEMFFSDLLIFNTGLRFNMTTITHEKIYYLDTDKGRNGIKKDFTGVSVFHYQLAKRKSTSQITGIMSLISSTVSDHTMEGIAYGVYDLELENQQLGWKEQQLLYRDMPTDKDDFRPVAFDAKAHFFVENQKLMFEYAPTYYDVDPTNLQRILSKDQYPVFLTKEL